MNYDPNYTRSHQKKSPILFLKRQPQTAKDVEVDLAPSQLRSTSLPGDGDHTKKFKCLLLLHFFEVPKFSLFVNIHFRHKRVILLQKRPSTKVVEYIQRRF